MVIESGVIIDTWKMKKEVRGLTNKGSKSTLNSARPFTIHLSITTQPFLNYPLAPTLLVSIASSKTQLENSPIRIHHVQQTQSTPPTVRPWIANREHRLVSLHSCQQYYRESLLGLGLNGQYQMGLRFP
jgi:hypothetical protein